jgi:tol-pal system beta propeller repeat protein TolB
LRTGDLEIFVMNADGTSPINLTNSANTDLFSSWSPDGTKIAFHTFRDAGSGLQSEIYVMNVNGSNQTNLSQNAAIDVNPQWSPDGSKIAFMRQVPFSSDAEIFVMDAATGMNQTNLSNNPAADAGASWSPDGSKIAFDSSRDDDFGEVYVMNADGSDVTRITNSGGNANPAWSPDGTKIAFATNRDGEVQIYVMNTNGSGQIPLTAPPGRNALPHWGTAGAGPPMSCAEGVSAARARIDQLLAGRPFLRAVANFSLTRVQAGVTNAERNFRILMNLLAGAGLISAQDAAELKDLVAPC